MRQIETKIIDVEYLVLNKYLIVVGIFGCTNHSSRCLLVDLLVSGKIFFPRPA